MKTIFIAFVFALSMVTNAGAQNIRLEPRVQAAQGAHYRAGNTVLTFTLAEPFSTTLKAGSIMLTQGFQQPEKPQPPTAPASQTVCSDTAVTFVFSTSITGRGADQIEWSYDSAFTYSTIVNRDSNVLIQVNIGSTDTIWFHSRVSGSKLVSETKVYTILKVNLKPRTVTPPVPVTMNSDTAYHFVFADMKAATEVTR